MIEKYDWKLYPDSTEKILSKRIQLLCQLRIHFQTQKEFFLWTVLRRNFFCIWKWTLLSERGLRDNIRLNSFYIIWKDMKMTMIECFLYYVSEMELIRFISINDKSMIFQILSIALERNHIWSIQIIPTATFYQYCSICNVLL